jgi:hypothetical protein
LIKKEQPAAVDKATLVGREERGKVQPRPFSTDLWRSQSAKKDTSIHLKNNAFLSLNFFNSFHLVDLSVV